MPLGAAKAALLGAAGTSTGDHAITWIAGANGTGSSGTLEFTGIPQTYNGLRIVLSNAQSATEDQCIWVINGETSADYKRIEYRTWDTTVETGLYGSAQANYWPFMGVGAINENVGALMMEWHGYTMTSGYHQSWAQSQFGNSNTINTTSVGGITYQQGSIAAITSIACKIDNASYHWQTPTRIDLYGIGTNA